MKNITLSKKHGLNPSMIICFWCKQETGEIALLGKFPKDVKAPRHIVTNYKPCPKCEEAFSKGVLLIEATTEDNGSLPIQANVYPTGNYWVVTKDAAQHCFPDLDTTKHKKFFIDKTIATELGLYAVKMH